MSDPRWTKPLTQDEMADRLGIACCALDKIAEWTDDDSDKFGDPGLFAKTALYHIYGGGLPKGEDSTAVVSKQTGENHG